MQSQNVPYQKQYTFQERQLECKSIMEKHPETIPIIVEKNLKSKLELSDKKKYLVLKTFKVFHLTSVIRKRMKMSKVDALYLFVSQTDMLKPDTLISEVYEKYKDKDGFLYIEYSELPTFGFKILMDLKEIQSF